MCGEPGWEECREYLEMCADQDPAPNLWASWLRPIYTSWTNLFQISPTFREFLGEHGDPRVVRIRTPLQAGSWRSGFCRNLGRRSEAHTRSHNRIAHPQRRCCPRWNSFGSFFAWNCRRLSWGFTALYSGKSHFRREARNTVTSLVRGSWHIEYCLAGTRSKHPAPHLTPPPLF